MKKKQKLSDEARQMKNAYLRRWRKNNPKKTRQHQINYWEKKAQEQQNNEEVGNV